ncbi:alpha/beta fold hydrolase [Streptomyces sp. NPDC006285]|uniref:alpha/beta fold hydrolase n=1 Tax=Streptomyces sp. NPDC006285 TaxID=3364742 RepID=UPI0036BBA780
MTYEDTAGPLPLVVVPGMLCDARLWNGIRFPEGHDVRHVALRRPDIGALADDVLASAPGPFVLVGLSLGAIVGFEVLRRAPRRVAGLCVMATNAGAPRREQYAAWRAMDGLIAAGRFEDVVEGTLPDMFPDRSPTPEGAWRYRAMARAVGATAARAQLAAQATRRDAADVLSTVRCPTVVLAGARDTLCPPAFHHAIADTVPGADLRLLPDAGHLLPLQRPEAVTAALRELVETVARTGPTAVGRTGSAAVARTAPATVARTGPTAAPRAFP